MSGRIATALIVLFWVAMMSLLVKREIAPQLRASREAARTPGYSRLEQMTANGPLVRQMGIYLGTKRVGQTLLRVTRDEEELRISNVSQMTLSGIAAMAGPVAPPGGALEGVSMRIHFKATVLRGRLNDFDMSVTSPLSSEPLAIASGYASTENEITIRSHIGGETRTHTVPFNAQQILSSDFMPGSVNRGIKVGDEWPVRSFGLDSTNWSVRVGRARVMAREPIEAEGKTWDTYRIVTRFDRLETTIWATADGEVLKQKMLAFVLLREKPADAPEEPAPHD